MANSIWKLSFNSPLSISLACGNILPENSVILNFPKSELERKIEEENAKNITMEFIEYIPSPEDIGLKFVFDWYRQMQELKEEQLDKTADNWHIIQIDKDGKEYDLGDGWYPSDLKIDFSNK